MNRVQGKVVIVTGGASGIGKQDALLLAGEGARVVITDLNEDGGHSLAREIGGDAMFVRHDISSEDNWKAVMTATQDRFGRLDGLVNNAGVLVMGSIEDATLEQWQKIHRIQRRRLLSRLQVRRGRDEVERRRLDRQHVVGGGGRPAV